MGPLEADLFLFEVGRRARFVELEDELQQRVEYFPDLQRHFLPRPISTSHPASQ